MQVKILQFVHSSPIARHVGFMRSLQFARSNFIWWGFKGKLKQVIRECDVCQLYKVENIHPVDLFQPLSVSQHIWTNISMDFVEGLSNFKGYSVVMVVVDWWSKDAHFVALKNPFIASKIATYLSPISSNFMGCLRT